MNRKKYRDHPTIVELKKKGMSDSSRINLIHQIDNEELLAYIAIFIKDDVIRRAAFLRIENESIVKFTMEKIKENEKLQNVKESFFDS
ncbi:MAG: hypothetical protein ACXAD7_15735 [Candidatus Kariarchaeaceae archaeon]